MNPLVVKWIKYAPFYLCDPFLRPCSSAKFSRSTLRKLNSCFYIFHACARLLGRLGRKKMKSELWSELTFSFLLRPASLWLSFSLWLRDSLSPFSSLKLIFFSPHPSKKHVPSLFLLKDLCHGWPFSRLKDLSRKLCLVRFPDFAGGILSRGRWSHQNV